MGMVGSLLKGERRTREQAVSACALTQMSTAIPRAQPRAGQGTGLGTHRVHRPVPVCDLCV